MKYLIRFFLGTIFLLYIVFKDEYTRIDIIIVTTIILIIAVSYFLHYKLDKVEKKK